MGNEVWPAGFIIKPRFRKSNLQILASAESQRSKFEKDTHVNFCAYVVIIHKAYWKLKKHGFISLIYYVAAS